MPKREKRKTKAKPIAAFRVYPEGRVLYCEVNIWPTKKAMRAYTKLSQSAIASCGGREKWTITQPRKGRMSKAAMLKYLNSRRGRMRKTGLFAEANFHRRQIGIEVVSHEMTHAAFAFAQRRKMNLADVVDKTFQDSGRSNTLDIHGPEERFCYALGQMCRQFTQKCYDLGLYREVVEGA